MTHATPVQPVPREGAGFWGRGIEMAKLTNETFDGCCDFLPFAASIERLDVPLYPTSGDFQLAAMRADDSPVNRWQTEAIRYRRMNPGAELDTAALYAIAQKVCANIYRVVTEQ